MARGFARRGEWRLLCGHSMAAAEPQGQDLAAARRLWEISEAQRVGPVSELSRTHVSEEAIGPRPASFSGGSSHPIAGTALANANDQ